MAKRIGPVKSVSKSFPYGVSRQGYLRGWDSRHSRRALALEAARKLARKIRREVSVYHWPGEADSSAVNFVASVDGAGVWRGSEES